jgi:hypothetical protein
MNTLASENSDTATRVLDMERATVSWYPYTSEQSNVATTPTHQHLGFAALSYVYAIHRLLEHQPSGSFVPASSVTNANVLRAIFPPPALGQHRRTDYPTEVLEASGGTALDARNVVHIYEAGWQQRLRSVHGGRPGLAIATDVVTIMPLYDTKMLGQLRVLETLRTLRSGWDSYDAEPISGVAIRAAKNLLVLLPGFMSAQAPEHSRPWAIAPMVDGGVQLEWRQAGKALEVEVGPHGEYAYLYIESEGDTRTFEEDNNVPFGKILTLIERTTAK